MPTDAEDFGTAWNKRMDEIGAERGTEEDLMLTPDQLAAALLAHLDAELVVAHAAIVRARTGYPAALEALREEVDFWLGVQSGHDANLRATGAGRLRAIARRIKPELLEGEG